MGETKFFSQFLLTFPKFPCKSKNCLSTCLTNTLLLNDPQIVLSLSDKTKFIAKIFSDNSTFEDSGISLHKVCVEHKCSWFLSDFLF